ncbi:MAG: SpoIIE family protein phosphatase [Peptococcaceae bacterium]
MDFIKKRPKDRSGVKLQDKSELYKDNSMKIIVLAGTLMLLSIILIGIIVYSITQREIVKKLKEQDIMYIAESVTAKINARVSRAKETSQILTQDAYIASWIEGEEKDSGLTLYATQRLHDIVETFAYDNGFMVSVTTNNYWTDDGEVIKVVSRDDPFDRWFFDFLDRQKLIEVNIDYNDQRNDTFVFINALMKKEGRPLAVMGVGLSLKDLSDDLKNYTFSHDSNIWLVDKSGAIYLSDRLEYNGRKLQEYLPVSFVNKLTDKMLNGAEEPTVFDYEQTDGGIYDVILYPIKGTDWNLVMQINRQDTVGLLQKIKLYSIIVAAIFIISVGLLFFFISRYIANPYKRTLLINSELERKVRERTRELEEKNMKILDSIDYAQRLQESILPREEELKKIFKEYFLLWKPRDLVGGDFYWVKKCGQGVLICVGDCTGHGVPGALMTMLAVGLLNQIEDKTNPAYILSQLSSFIKDTLNQQRKDAPTDDGLDMAVCYFDGKNKLVYAGAKIDLYLRTEKELKICKGQRKGLGYKRTAADFPYLNTELEISAGDMIYITTDGLTDQSGGEKGLSYGKRRLRSFIETNYRQPLARQGELLTRELLTYLGDESPRDDITLLIVKL